MYFRLSDVIDKNKSIPEEQRNNCPKAAKQGINVTLIRQDTDDTFISLISNLY